MDFPTLEKKNYTIDNNNWIWLTERIKRKIYPILIWGNSLMPMANTTTSTINTIGAPIVTTITLWTATSLLTACGGEDWPDWPIDIKDTTPPTINVIQSSIDITWWKEIRITWNQLYIWDILVASRTDDKSKNCKVLLSINWNTISSWTILNEKWTLKIQVSDEAWNIKSTNIQLNIISEQDISWLENIKNIPLQVDQEVNLLQGITFGNGASLVKVQIEKDWQTNDIPDPQHYIPEYPWTCNIILTVKNKEWNTTEYKVDNLNIKALEYKSPEIRNIQPKEILPIVWNINKWDKKIYEYIEHLRIAECTRIRDMMRKYWAWNYSPEEYQQLMLRLHTWMIWEIPSWFNNFEIIGEKNSAETEHWYRTRDILNTIINHANFIVLADFQDSLDELYQKQPQNSINIFAESIWSEQTSKEKYNKNNSEYVNFKKYLNKNNFILFVAWTNLCEIDNNSINKICQENTDLPDNHSIYSIPQSSANSKNDWSIKNMFLTIWTDKDWDANISNASSWSNFPVWFHPKILFSWRAFPYHNSNWNVYGEEWNYVTSFTNYANLGMTGECFQMRSDVTNGNELMNMIRNTSLTDQIHLNWQTQNLYLINPAWFFKEYNMPNIPSEINEWSTISLEKWFYKWIIFDIPGAEVNINWEWIPYNQENESFIKSQNPIYLKWRLNWKLCKKMWYNQNNPIKWKIITTDDNFNWLNITKDISINIK